MKHFFATAAIALTLLSNAALAAEQQIAKILVGQLTCPSCAYIVATSMSTVPTVDILDFLVGEDPYEGIFTVSFDDASATPQMIVEAVISNGYPAELVANDT